MFCYSYLRRNFHQISSFAALCSQILFRQCCFWDIMPLVLVISCVKAAHLSSLRYTKILFASTLCGNGAPPLLHIIRLHDPPVSRVRLCWASVLALFVPDGLQQAPWDIFDRSPANMPELDRPSSHFLTTRISPEKPVWATSAYNPGKYGKSPIGCRPKEDYVFRKHKQAAALSFFCYLLGPLCIYATCSAFGG
jgi:hypothetical protein